MDTTFQENTPVKITSRKLIVTRINKHWEIICEKVILITTLSCKIWVKKNIEISINKALKITDLITLLARIKQYPTHMQHQYNTK